MAGETTPRWEVDEDENLGPLLRWPGMRGAMTRMTLPHGRTTERTAAWDALVADVRAAREHDHCPRDIDTLRDRNERATAVLGEAFGHADAPYNAAALAALSILRGNDAWLSEETD